MAKFNKHVIIVGTARSGTSWLSETIARQHRYRMLFEPEQETRTRRGYLLCDQWIQNREEAPEAHHYLKQVFANRVDCDWIAQNSNRRFKRHLWPLVPKKYIIKFVRANLLASFMNATFEIPIIHMIRNPYAVIQSQLQVNFPWLTDMRHFAGQPKLVKLIHDYASLNIKDLSGFSKVQLLALRWCIENVIPLELLPSAKGHYEVVRYEDLFEDLQYFYQLCDRFDLQPISSLEQDYRFPSSKTHSRSALLTKKSSYSMDSTSDLDAIQGILNTFKTQLYPTTYPKASLS